MNFKKFFEAIKDLSKAKNIAEDSIKNVFIASLKDVYVNSLINDYQNKNDFDEKILKPKVEVEINDKNKKNIDFIFFQIKTVKQKVENDLLEITLEDAKKIFKNKNIKINDEIKIKDNKINSKLTNFFIEQFKKIFRQKLNSEERNILFNKQKNHIGEIVNGIVEKMENRGAIINIDKNNIFLSRKNMIGNEFFSIGQQIEVYLDLIKTKNQENKIIVTRTNKNFLKKIFEKEIYDIYDGTVEIKDIARKPGIKSKVSVFSKNKEINAVGSCIGKNGGENLNNIIKQLNGEKINIVAYDPDPIIYVINALKPTEIIGVNINLDQKKIICITKNEREYFKALSGKKINLILAEELTNFKIILYTKNNADKEKISYITIEELKLKNEKKNIEKEKIKFIKQSSIYKDKENENDDINDINEKNKKEQEIKQDINEQKQNIKEKQDFIEIKKIINISELEKKIKSNNDEKIYNKKNIIDKENKDKDKNKENEKKIIKNNEENIIKTIENNKNNMSVYSNEELKQFKNEENDENKTNNYEYNDEYDDYDDDNK